MKKSKLYLNVLNAVSVGFLIDIDATGLLINDGEIVGQLDSSEDQSEICE